MNELIGQPFRNVVVLPGIAPRIEYRKPAAVSAGDDPVTEFAHMENAVGQNTVDGIVVDL